MGGDDDAGDDLIDGGLGNDNIDDFEGFNTFPSPPSTWP